MNRNHTSRLGEDLRNRRHITPQDRSLHWGPSDSQARGGAPDHAPPAPSPQTAGRSGPPILGAESHTGLSLCSPAFPTPFIFVHTAINNRCRLLL